LASLLLEIGCPMVPPPPGLKEQNEGGSPEKHEHPVLGRVRAIVKELELPGEVLFFGSHASGLHTAGSDCDIVYLHEGSDNGETPVMTLQRFAAKLPEHGFHCVVTVFNAAVPLLKAVDPDGIDVDICVGNILGYHNSRLLAAYCRLDWRIAALGQRVKQWAGSFELIGSSDGHLNSYAYSLLTVFYLMHTSPPVVTNIQALADREPALACCSRYGMRKEWKCGFWDETEMLPRTRNTESLAELLLGFFYFYLHFDWPRYAVSIRLALTCIESGSRNTAFPDKFLIVPRASWDSWYVEDPFDLEHNLAAKCTQSARRRILQAMRQARSVLKSTDDDEERLKTFQDLCNNQLARQQVYLMKCRVNCKKISAEDFAGAFSECNVLSLHFPRGPLPASSDEKPEAFMEFRSESDRKRAHMLNETYVKGWQLRLFVCSAHALEDAIKSGMQYEKMEGWQEDSRQSESDKDEKKRWKVRERSQRKEQARTQQVEAQRQRVRDGIHQAEGFDELEVLRQRAQALGLDDEVQEAKTKLRAVREASSANEGHRDSQRTTTRGRATGRHAPPGSPGGGSCVGAGVSIPNGSETLCPVDNTRLMIE